MFPAMHEPGRQAAIDKAIEAIDAHLIAHTDQIAPPPLTINIEFPVATPAAPTA